MNVLHMEDISLAYTERGKPVLEIAEADFFSGLNFIVGRNGSGKSTLLKALSGYTHSGLMPKGTIQLNGSPYRGAGVGLVDQRPLASINPDLTFLENLLLATLKKSAFLGLGYLATQRRTQILEELLHGLGTLELAQSLYPVEASKLSAGQQQLLAIIMRLIRNQSLLLLDECTANLDSLNTRMIVTTLLTVASKGAIILFATHQRELLEDFDANIYEVCEGTIVCRRSSPKGQERLTRKDLR